MPGGKRNRCDESDVVTAQRECGEEIQLKGRLLERMEKLGEEAEPSVVTVTPPASTVPAVRPPVKSPAGALSVPPPSTSNVVNVPSPADTEAAVRGAPRVARDSRS